MPLDIFQGWLSKAGFRQDQARGKGGRWVPEGRGRTRAMVVRGFDLSAGDPSIYMVQEVGADQAGAAFKSVMKRLPPDIRELLRTVPKKAVYDMARYGPELGEDPNDPSGVFVGGFFNSARGVVVGQGWTNDKFGFLTFANPGGTLDRYAAHELGHAFDYYSTPGVEDGFSTALSGVLMSEYGNLSRAQRYYSEHYSAEHLAPELFADVFAAMYAGPGNPKDKNYIGYSLTQKQTLNRFPRTVAAIKAWKPAS